jgi:predicted dehydrogenase
MNNTISRRALLGAAVSLPAFAAGAKKLRVGVVGGRFGATFHWHLHPDCVVTSVCDLLPDRQRHLATYYRCPNVAPSFADMLKDPNVDAVAVFTPAPLHASQAVQALKAGKHVISAVPAGMNVEEIEQLLATVRSTGLKYMMAETSYYRRPVIACREWNAAHKFGTIFHSESDYHHEGLISLMFDADGRPSWRHGLPPMLYPTHCVGMIVPVTGERMSEVTCTGWGDNNPVLRKNRYNNPFWNETAFFRTSGGHSARVSICWHAAVTGAERGAFYGDRMSYQMGAAETDPDTRVEIARKGATSLDTNGYPEGDVESQRLTPPTYLERLPEPLRAIRSGHGNSHTFLVHEFVSAVLADRTPAVNIWEAIAYTLPGILAHQSALRNGETIRIRDYGKAPA